MAVLYGDGVYRNELHEAQISELKTRLLEQKFFEFMLWTETLIVSIAPFLKPEDIFDITEYTPKTVRFKKEIHGEEGTKMSCWWNFVLELTNAQTLPRSNQVCFPCPDGGPYFCFKVSYYNLEEEKTFFMSGDAFDIHGMQNDLKIALKEHGGLGVSDKIEQLIDGLKVEISDFLEQKIRTKLAGMDNSIFSTLFSRTLAGFAISEVRKDLERLFTLTKDFYSERKKKEIYRDAFYEFNRLVENMGVELYHTRGFTKSKKIEEIRKKMEAEADQIMRRTHKADPCKGSEG